MQPREQVDVRQFKRVFILYNRYSGKQFFASMITSINEVYKLLKQELDAEVELLDVKYFEQMPELAQRAADEKCDWVIIAGGGWYGPGFYRRHDAAGLPSLHQHFSCRNSQSYCKGNVSAQ